MITLEQKTQYNRNRRIKYAKLKSEFPAEHQALLQQGRARNAEYRNLLSPDKKHERCQNDNERAKRMLRFLNLLKQERGGCYDCGNNFPPEAMDWDHLPQFEKLFNIGSQYRKHKLEDIVSEVNKCQLVCANCHRIRTASRTQERNG